MRFLLDTCVARGVKDALVAGGYDVTWAGDWTEDPGDEEILARAQREGRVLVTIDKDFGELAIVRGLPHHGIIRLAGLSTRQQATACLRVVQTHAKDIEARAVITVEPGRVRIRPA